MVVTVHVVSNFKMSLANFPQVRIWLNISSFIQRRIRNELQETQINEINTENIPVNNACAHFILLFHINTGYH